MAFPVSGAVADDRVQHVDHRYFRAESLGEYHGSVAPEPWWNPAVEAQASDRAPRIDQQRPVTISRLIVKDSIEERIVALHRHKRDLTDAMLEGADASGRLSEEDLLDLIRAG